MKPISATYSNSPQTVVQLKRPANIGDKSKLARLVTAIGALAACCLALSAEAQTSTLLATNQNIFVGANFNGIYTNSQLRVAVTNAGISQTLSVSGAPAGVSILFSTNTYLSAANPLVLSNSWSPVWYSVAVTNVAKGVYPLTFTCGSLSATVNLIVGTLWTNNAIIGSADPVLWGAGANWSGGAPGASDDVIFTDYGNTNYVNADVTVSSLTFLPISNLTNQNMAIASGKTVSVLGTNSFTLNNDSYTSQAKVYALNVFGSGGAALVVSNKQGVFSANSSQGTGGATSGLQLNMTNLDNFSAIVGRFGLGDWTMVKAGGVAANELATASGANGVQFAKTNFIAAYSTGDYALTNLNPTFAISLLKEGDAFNNGSAQNINLGISNVIQAESLALAQNRAGGNPNYLRFNPVFTNVLAASMPYVSFRNTNGGRMNLVGIGIDSGTSNPGSNTRGRMDFFGGMVDMLVDTIWLGRDRTGSVSTNTGAVALGILNFSGGTIDVNTLIAGYQAYTNNSPGQGTIQVGGAANSTAVLIVNSNLTLGYTAGDFSATPGSVVSGTTSGQITILTNGVVRAKQITVGQIPGQLSPNRITLSPGGTLEVTNTTGDSGHRLQQLVNNGGINVVHMNGTSTLIYCSNMLAAAGSKITIGAPAGPVVLNTAIPVISFLNNNGSAGSYSWSGVAPLGVNVIVTTSGSSVDVTLSTGTPKTLRWVGNVNSTWDTSSFNWVDTATALSTNFVTGDKVIFDDTASQYNIDISGDVLPSQAGIGIAMTNTTMPYTFSTTSAGRILGSASLVKQGANLLTVDLYTELGVNLGQGSLTNTAAGTIGSVTAGVGTAFANGGTVLGSVASAGTANNFGSISGGLTAKSSGVVTNGVGGTVAGGLATESGSFLYNAGTLTGIGSATVVSNALFINAGTIANGSKNAGSLTVASYGTFKDMGLAAGAVMNLTTLTISDKGTFIPGGDGIGTTKVINDGDNINYGRILFSTGSTNIFKVDMSASPSNTMVTCGSVSFGPNQNTLQQNGGNILLSQIGGPAYAAGQSFKLVGNNFNGAPFDAGLNTTNSLPLIIPSVPASGLAWDLSQTIHGGVIGIKTIPTTGTNIVFSSSFAQTISTNVPPITNNVIVLQLAWPEEYIGWQLQQQQNTLDIGLSTNWTQIAAAQFTNNIVLTNSIAPGAVFYRMISP